MKVLTQEVQLQVAEAPPVLAPPYASVPRRAVAAVLDGLLLLGTAWLLSGGAGPDDGFGVILTGAADLAVLLTLGLYYVLLEAWTGRTIGKLVTGIRVFAEDGSAAGMPAAVIRNVLRIVDGFLFYLVGGVAAYASPARQRVGDRLAGTVVIRTRGRQLPSPPWTDPARARRSPRHQRRVAATLGVSVMALASLVAMSGQFELELFVSRQPSSEAVELAILLQLRDSRLPTGDVRCPPELPDDASTSFVCTVRLDRQELDLRVERHGDSVSFQALESVMPVDLVESVMGTSIEERAGVTVVVDCGPRNYLVQPPQSTFDCLVTYDGSRTAPVTATVEDTDGNFTFGLP